MNPLGKVPFSFLSVSLAGGVILGYYFDNNLLSVVFILFGIFTMLFSFLSFVQVYRWRFLFGIGTFFTLLGVGSFSVSVIEKKTDFYYTGKANIYVGVVESLPEDRLHTQAYTVKLTDTEHRIVCYFSYDAVPESLHPGDEIIFLGQVYAFRNAGNPDDFDYKSYMRNHGYSGFVYIDTDKWFHTERKVSSVLIYAEQCREYLLGQYKSLQLNDNEYAILSALTLGYQNALSDDLKESFRNTGTAHVLSVSGLHVGIIYMAIAFLLGFLRTTGRLYWLRPTLILIFLFVYAFVTGLSPSVVRAVVMLSVVCIAQLFKRKSFSFNNLFIAAFAMLLINPLWLFDIGFQLSFSAVFAILYLYPKCLMIFNPHSLFLKKVWGLLSLSIAAQLGTLPLCLFYFETFPVYFFIANLFVVPLASFVLYSGLAILILKPLSELLFLGEFVYHIPIFILQSSVKVMTYIMSFIENIPNSVIKDVNISLMQLLLFYFFIISFILFFIYRKNRTIYIGLISFFVFLCLEIYALLFADQKNEMIVYNRNDRIEIKYNAFHYECNYGDNTKDYVLLEIDTKRFLILYRDGWKNKVSTSKICLDYLLLTDDSSYSLSSINELFEVKQLILSGSLSGKTIERLVNESQKLGIECYDMREKGAYRTIF